MAIVVSSRGVLLKAIHLSPVRQSQRLCPAPVNKSDPQYEGRRDGTHPPYWPDSLSLVTFPDCAPVQIVTDRFASKKASRVNFLELRYGEVQHSCGPEATGSPA